MRKDYVTKCQEWLKAIRDLSDSELLEAIEECQKQGYVSPEERTIFVSLVADKCRRHYEVEQLNK